MQLISTCYTQFDKKALILGKIFIFHPVSLKSKSGIMGSVQYLDRQSEKVERLTLSLKKNTVFRILNSKIFL